MQYLAIAGGGAIGALLRYLLMNGTHSLLGRGFPYGTLLVNASGSFLIGFISIMLLEKGHYSPDWRGFLIVGILGSFTTFSTFSMESYVLFTTGEVLKGILNISANLGVCLLAVVIGVHLARNIWL